MKNMMSTFEKILKEVNTPWLMENSQKLMEIGNHCQTE